jgi:hypothetical protein
MGRALFGLLAILAVISLGSSWSAAGVIVPGNIKWYEFAFVGGAGSFATNGSSTIPSSGGNSQQADNPPWTFTSAIPTVVRVTDAFQPGDTFSLFDNATIVGPTSTPVGTPITTDNPDVAFAQPGYSHGAFTLAPGAHSLTIRVDATPVGSGAGYFRVDVPEPASAVLLLGAAAIAPVLRRRPRRA